MDFREDWHKTTDIPIEQGKGDPFAAAVRWSRMPMVFADPRQPDMPIVYANDAFSKLTGYTFDEIRGRNCRLLQGPDTDRDAIRAMAKSLETRQAIGLDILNYRKNGSTFWNALFISPVFNEQGELLYYFSSQFDATERRQHAKLIAEQNVQLETEVGRRTLELEQSLMALEAALVDKTNLLHEIEHRVKNNLLTISTLIGLQIRSQAEPQAVAALRALQERVDALGTVHRRLSNVVTHGFFDLAELVRDLVPGIVQAYSSGNIACEVDVFPVMMPSASAAPASLILNELLTNSMRHAWPNEEPGRLRVSLRRDGRHIVLGVADDGRGIATGGPSRPNSGLKLAEALVRQMRATLSIRALEPGTLVEVAIPSPAS